MVKFDHATDFSDHVQSLTSECVIGYAANLGFTIPDHELEETCEHLQNYVTQLWPKRMAPMNRPDVLFRNLIRDPGRAPTRGEDPYHAIVRFCEISGMPSGPLAGMRLGVKDNIAVAGIPMTSGISHETPPVPTKDSLVVERLLDAGATITAKTNIWPPRIPSIGDARNPLNPKYSPGFSSSGSGAAVAAHIVDAALGTDIGGSVRIPAAWCGLVGMKATRGLVPSCYGQETASDIGPITATVMDNARMLDVIAGVDRPARTTTCSYSSAARHGITGMQVGVPKEALEPSGCTRATLDAFDQSLTILSKLGARVTYISIPQWDSIRKIHYATQAFDQIASVGNLGIGTGYIDWADPALIAKFAPNSRFSARTIRLMLLAAEHLRQAGNVLPPSDIHNARCEFSRHLNTVLTDVDLLITPTTPNGPYRLDKLKLDDTSSVQDVISTTITNTWPINLTGNPALTVPCGNADHGLRTGLQIIGSKFDEYKVYQAGFALERNELTR